VWLVEELFERKPGGEHIEVNASLGRVDMVVRPDFDLRGFVRSVERFGYLFGPPVKRAAAASGDLLWRLGVCAAIAMNSMIFAIAMYAGLDRGPLFTLFTTLNFGLGALAVAVGGSVFVRSAWRAVRQRMLHLDLPIALGIALAFAGSAYSYIARRSQASYFDTLDVFITLMLLGRWLQERVIERNRAWLLACDGTDGLLARRVADGRIALVRCAELKQGDLLLVAPGDLVPVDARLQRGGATFSLDWIVGESRPRLYKQGDVVPAGAFASCQEAAVLCAETDFEGSPLRELLRAPEHSSDTARSSAWFQRLAKVYVSGVLAVAGAGFVAWWAGTHDVGRALSVTTAVLIVTCPCAFGIAAPLAYEMVQAGLRRAGLFVRRASFLDRARDVRRIIFDKTGTLTTGSLALTNGEVLSRLSDDQRHVLYDLVARSGHPKSTAVREALNSHGLALEEGARVVEQPGKGLELIRHGHTWRLGDPAWVTPECTDDGDVAFGVDGALLAEFVTAERLRPDAAREVRSLASDGYEVWLLSGDAQNRVECAADASGVPRERAIGGQTPHDKARFLDAHDRADSLFVGDGVNDALALDHAYVSGTPAVDRPYVPARADFFFVTPGLAPIRLALRSARALAQVVRADLAIALAYNVLAIGLALSGRMSPLLCAVLMPASSLTTIGATIASLSPRRQLWRS
jgi:Cu2+-exporting ATPase